jgi:hypothetical protein
LKRILVISSILALALLWLGFAPMQAKAQTGLEELGLFGDWGAFNNRAQGLCYAIAEPGKANKARRTAPYITLSQTRGAGLGPGQLMVAGGAPLRQVTLQAAGQSFQLTPRGAQAWMPESRGDGLVIQALEKANRITVQLITQRGTKLTDSYSLNGFRQAWNAAQKACAGG